MVGWLTVAIGAVALLRETGVVFSNAADAWIIAFVLLGAGLIVSTYLANPRVRTVMLALVLLLWIAVCILTITGGAVGVLGAVGVVVIAFLINELVRGG